MQRKSPELIYILGLRSRSCMPWQTSIFNERECVRFYALKKVIKRSSTPENTPIKAAAQPAIRPTIVTIIHPAEASNMALKFELQIRTIFLYW